MPALIVLSLLGLALLLSSSKSSASTPSTAPRLPRFQVNGKSGITWDVQTLRVQGDVSAYQVTGGTQVSTTGVIVMRYSHNRATGVRTFLGSELAANNPLLARARSDFGV